MGNGSLGICPPLIISFCSSSKLSQRGVSLFTKLHNPSLPRIHFYRHKRAQAPVLVMRPMSMLAAVKVFLVADAVRTPL